MLEHPLVQAAYERWSRLPRETIMAEVAVLFHLAVKLDDVIALKTRKDR